MNWEKCVFHREKRNFETIGNFPTYHRIFDLRKGTLNTLTPLSPNVNNANIRRYRKSIATKMYKYSLKNGSKVSKPKIWIFMQISIFFSYEMPTL